MYTLNMLTSFYERFMPLDDLGHGMFSCSTVAKNSVGNLQEVTAIAAHTQALTHTHTQQPHLAAVN